VQSVNGACLSAQDIEMNLSVDPTSCGIPNSERNVEPASNTTSRELELKFTTDSSGLALAFASPLLQSSVPDAPGRALASVYFDTPTGDLKKQGMVLRVRRAGRSAPVMTLKLKSGPAVWRPT
jgi:hypothetical protein